MEQGADVSILSLHKTAGALNQTAILNVSKNIQGIEERAFQNAVNIFETTSPSYPLLANIEACIQYLSSNKGKIQVDELFSDIIEFRNELTRFGIEFYDEKYHDSSKILLRKKGISGSALSDILFDKYDIEDEMTNSVSTLYLTGIGTTKSKLKNLQNALINVPVDSSFEFENVEFQPFPLVKIQPVGTFNQKYDFVKKEDSVLKISNKLIMPYPPGIGLLYPGEAIQEWHLKYLDDNVEVIV